MKKRMRFMLMIALVVLANGAAFPFGGENPLGPGENIHIERERKNWHHQDIAYDALIAAGFRPGPSSTGQGAAEAITWHADYIDSYLYNPLFWIPGGINRFKVSLATGPELLKLHFDDNFSLPAVQAAYRKYVTGTLAGLMWARERGDVASAHNILGVSLHAMADFYAHSNWVDDPARRDKTWFDMTPAQRNVLPLYIGAYEEPEQLGVKHHGKILPVCSAIKVGLIEQVLAVGCRGISPFTKMTICDHYRECTRAVNINPPASVAGINLPQGILYALPGMAMDTTWVAAIGYKERGLKDSNPMEIFQTAKTLAKKASTQWLLALEQQMNKLGAGDFWNRCKNESTWNSRHVPFENYAKFPYTFLSAGPYPLNPGRGTRSIDTSVVPFTVGGTRAATMETTDRAIEGLRVSKLQNLNDSGAVEVSDQPLRPKPFPIRPPIKFMPPVRPDTPVIIRPPGGIGTVLTPIPGTLVQAVKDEFYLRLKLTTSRDANSGTDSDIIAHVDGKQFLLDYMPRENPLIAYNDLEAGDEQSYVVGPFDKVPASITFENRSASAGEVLVAFGKAFVDAIVTVIEKIGDFLLSLVGGHADFVGQGGRLFEPGELAGIGSSWRGFTRNINGGDEGNYTIHGAIRKVGETNTGHPAADTASYQVRLDTLQCHNESKIDRLSSSDEPYVLAILVPHPGPIQRMIRGPYDDVDRGENRSIGHTFSTVTIPKSYGRLSVQFQIWESDDESSSSRNTQLNEFATRADNATNPSERGLLDTIGAALAADWKLGHMEVYAFGRGGRVHAGKVFDQTVNRWVEGKKTVTFNLNPSACRDLGVTADDLMRPPPGRSGFKPSDVLIPEIKQPRQAPRRSSSGLGFLPFLGIGGILIATACALGRRRN